MRACPPPYLYGLSCSRLAAQTACCTSAGASAGAAAVPSGSSCAFVPGTVMSSAATGAGAGGTGGGNVTPPVDCAEATLGTARNASRKRANARSENKLTNLFRLPAGLADGLALKEPAPHATLDVTRPKQPGSPAP